MLMLCNQCKYAYENECGFFVYEMGIIFIDRVFKKKEDKD